MLFAIWKISNASSVPMVQGDLIFLRETRRGTKGRTYTEPIGFFGVPDVRAVERTLRGLAESVH
jgi:hypothetical protein